MDDPNGGKSQIAGEWIVFMCLALYIVVACLKEGIWDRKLKADANTNAKVSFIGGSVAALVIAVVTYVRFGTPVAAIWIFVLNFFFISILCFAGLTFIAVIYKKRVEKLEEDADEEVE